MSFVKTIARRALRSLNIAVPIQVGEARFRAPIIGGVGTTNRHDAEPWMTDVLRRLLAVAPRTGFIDVGVNLGQTLLKLRSLDASIPYVGFEPSPLCVQYSNEVIRMNGFQNCSVIPVGLSDKPEVCEFFAIQDDDSAASIVEGLRPGQIIGRKQYVPVFPLDNLVQMLPPAVSIVKIDVEGAELEVLKGMGGLIDANRPWITCEVLHSHTREQIPYQHGRNENLMQLVTGKGYSVYQIVKTGGSAGLKPVEAFSEGVYGPQSPPLCDYLFAPPSKAAATIQAFAN